MTLRLYGWMMLLAVTSSAHTAAAQSSTPTLAVDVTAEEIAAVAKAMTGGDEEIKIVDLGKYNLGVAVLKRGALKPANTVTALNHTRLTEIYYVTSGSGTLVTGGEVTNVKPMADTNPLVTTVVGPSNTAVFTKPAQVRVIKAGDVVVIPAGVYHGWSEIPDHVQYVSVRPDVERVLPGGYINPTLKK
jgi:mannose-6-phosphate isomerase-like protein (cupin superfamily)